jgi:hypothetical protein
VTRQTIIVQAEATGVVEPINVIEVKGKVGWTNCRDARGDRHVP